jgi:hypothetical protein
MNIQVGEQSRRFVSRLLRLLPSISAVVLVTLGLVIVSVWIASGTSQLIGVRETPSLPFFYLGLFVGIFLVLSLLPLAVKGVPEYATSLRQATKTWFFSLSVLGGVLCVALFAELANSIEPYEKQPALRSWWMHLHHDPGGIFAAFTGVATIYGLAFTIQSLREIRRTISSFPELIDRVEEMAATATESQPLKILAYTPAVGKLALRDHDWTRFRKAITRDSAEGRPTTNIVCLERDDLGVWHRLFEGRRTLKKKLQLEDVDAATDAAESLLDRLQQKDSFGKMVAGTVHRLPWHLMPGFYVFFTRKRALIVTPLFLPFPRGAPKTLQEDLPSVQMIGLETGDRSVINDIEKFYDYYASLPGGGMPKGSQVVTNTDLEDWLKNPDNANGTMRQLRDDLLKSFEKTDAEYKAGSQFELSLNAIMRTWQ